DRILEWDPFAMPIMSEVAGTIRYEDLVPGATYTEVLDAVTGLSHRVVTEAKAKEDLSKQPRIIVTDEQGNPIVVQGSKRIASYTLPVGANIVVNPGDVIDAGTVTAKVQRESTKTK